jgi:Zn-dependent protease
MENFLLKLSIMLVPALFAITCHEVSHGYVADKFGDSTARQMGRLTLNPLKHLDIIGTLMVFVIGIGWAKPVPVNFNNLRNPKRDMIWVALAGPVTNISLAVVSALCLRGLATISENMIFVSPVKLMMEPVFLMLAFSIYINLLLAIFNLIPIPPLDGGRVVTGLLPYRQAITYSRLEPYGMIIIIALILLPGIFPLFPNIFSYVIFPIADIGIRLLAGPESMLVNNFLMR